MFINILREPLLRNLDVESSERIAVHRAILDAKPIMKSVCREMYALCAELDKKYFSGDGQRIELGAGVSFIKDFFPNVLVTDIVPAAHLDTVLDAQNMHNISDNSVRTFFGIHCFHHFPEPRKFFSELTRTLTPGGGCVLIEPYFGPLAQLIYPRLFATEKFDMSQPSWETPGAGAMNDANQALSYVVMFRDRTIFDREFPGLKIVHSDQLTNYPRYVLSGGLNFRSLVPDFSTPLLRLLESALSPLRRWLALHHVVVIRKIA
jgi:hypothetical protein